MKTTSSFGSSNPLFKYCGSYLFKYYPYMNCKVKQSIILIVSIMITLLIWVCIRLFAIICELREFGFVKSDYAQGYNKSSSAWLETVL